MKIFIPQKIIEDERIDNYALIAYSYLKVLTPLSEMKTYYISLDALLFAIFNTTKISARMRDNIWNGLCLLYDLDYFNGHRVSSKRSFIVETKSLCLDTQLENFIVLYLEDICKIMLSDKKTKTSLFSYYTFLMDTLSSQTKVYLESGKYKKNVVGNQTIVTLSYLCGISAHTIIRHNQSLEELNVIYIHHSDDVFANSSFGFKKLNNVYGRYEDREYIEKYVSDYKAHFQSHSYLKKERTLANNDRRLSKMYYWLCKGKDYSESEIQEIYYYITNLNRKYENLSIKEQDDSYLAKIKDEKIFDKFEFLKIKEK